MRILLAGSALALSSGCALFQGDPSDDAPELFLPRSIDGWHGDQDFIEQGGTFTAWAELDWERPPEGLSVSSGLDDRAPDGITTQWSADYSRIDLSWTINEAKIQRLSAQLEVCYGAEWVEELGEDCLTMPFPLEAEVSVGDELPNQIWTPDDELSMLVGEVRPFEPTGITTQYGLLTRTSFDYFTDDPSIASVDEHGFVTAHSAGDTYLHATVGDDWNVAYPVFVQEGTPGPPTERVLLTKEAAVLTYLERFPSDIPRHDRIQIDSNGWPHALISAHGLYYAGWTGSGLGFEQLPAYDEPAHHAVLGLGPDDHRYVVWANLRGGEFAVVDRGVTDTTWQRRSLSVHPDLGSGQTFESGDLGQFDNPFPVATMASETGVWVAYAFSYDLDKLGEDYQDFGLTSPCIEAVRLAHVTPTDITVEDVSFEDLGTLDCDFDTHTMNLVLEIDLLDPQDASAKPDIILAWIHASPATGLPEPTTGMLEFGTDGWGPPAEEAPLWAYNTGGWVMSSPNGLYWYRYFDDPFVVDAPWRDGFEYDYLHTPDNLDFGEEFDWNIAAVAGAEHAYIVGPELGDGTGAKQLIWPITVPQPLLPDNSEELGLRLATRQSSTHARHEALFSFADGHRVLFGGPGAWASDGPGEPWLEVPGGPADPTDDVYWTDDIDLYRATRDDVNGAGFDISMDDGDTWTAHVDLPTTRVPTAAVSAGPSSHLMWLSPHVSQPGDAIMLATESAGTWSFSELDQGLVAPWKIEGEVGLIHDASGYWVLVGAYENGGAYQRKMIVSHFDDNGSLLSRNEHLYGGFPNDRKPMMRMAARGTDGTLVVPMAVTNRTELWELVTSKDDGATWLGATINLYGYGFPDEMLPIQALPDGSFAWVDAWYGGDDNGGRTLVSLRTSADGLSWTEPEPVRPQGGAFQRLEGIQVEPDGGLLLAFGDSARIGSPKEWPPYRWDTGIVRLPAP